MSKASDEKRALSPSDNTAYNEKAARLTDRGNFLISPIFHLLLIGILGFIAYSNTFHSPFQWDEAVYIKEKPFIKDLSYFEKSLTGEGMDDLALRSRYIGYLTFALNYKLGGFNVFGYHIVNLAIHLMNALLVYFLVLLTFRTPYFKAGGKGQGAKGEGLADNQTGIATTHDLRVFDYSLFTTHYSRFIALAVALLFVAHPVQTEAVTYIFQRLASLVTMFYLLSLVLYINGRLASWHAGKLASYFLSLLCAICAMKTKENAFTLPVVITLYEFLFFCGSLKKRALRLAPFLVTMAIIPVTLIGMNRPAGEIMNQIKDPASLGVEVMSRGEYLFTQFRVIVTYIRLLFFPVNQTLYYDYPVYRSFFEPPVLMSALFLAALLGTAVYLIYRSRVTVGGGRSGVGGLSLEPQTSNLYRLIGFGILWFLITLSVESGIIPIAMLIDEYRIYLPSVGFFIAVVAMLLLLAQKFPGRSPGKLKAAVALLSLIVLTLASATYARNNVWKDKISLWGDVVRKSPAFPAGYVNLGLAYYEKGLYDKAIVMYQRAIALFPVYLDAYINLGAAYTAAGRNDLAIEIYSRALQMYPYNGILYFNMAHAYAVSSQPGKAVENYIKAIRINPFNSKAYHDLGTVYARLGRLDDAIAAYTKFAELSPNDPEAYMNRGIVYASKGDKKRAEADFREACLLGNAESCGYSGNAP